jgi:hypothetical protein
MVLQALSGWSALVGDGFTLGTVIPAEIVSGPAILMDSQRLELGHMILRTLLRSVSSCFSGRALRRRTASANAQALNVVGRITDVGGSVPDVRRKKMVPTVKDAPFGLRISL